MAYSSKRLSAIKVNKLIKAQIEGKSVGESAKIAGYNQAYASTVLARPEVKAKLSDLLDKAGVSDLYLSKRIKELSKANETRFFAHQGVVIDERKVPALEIQRKTIELACKLKGHMVDRMEHDLGPEMLDRIMMMPSKPRLDDWDCQEAETVDEDLDDNLLE